MCLIARQGCRCQAKREEIMSRIFQSLQIGKEEEKNKKATRPFEKKLFILSDIMLADITISALIHK